MNLIFSIIAFIGLSTAHASFKTFTYSDRTWTRSISQTFSSKEIVHSDSKGFEINSYLTAKVIGMTIGNYHEKSIVDGNFSPKLDSRCRSPKKSGSKYNCYSRKFLNNGTFVFKEFNGKKTILDRALNSNSSNSQTIDFYNIFPDYDPETQNTYNITGLYFMTFQNDFGLGYDQKILYVTGLNEIYKVRLDISKNNTNLIIKINVLNSIKNINYPQEESSPLPGKFIYNINRKIITSMHFKTKSLDYILRLESI